MNARTLKGCFNEKIEREIFKTVDTVEVRIRNANLTAIDSIFTAKIELAMMSINASSGQDATSVMADSERGEHMVITALFENIAERNNTLLVFNTSHETRNIILDEVSELLVLGTHFNRQPHTHHMVIGKTAQTNQIPEFLAGRNLTPREPPIH